MPLLKFCGTGDTWEGEHIPDVRNAGHIHNQTLESQPIACMFAAAEPAQVKVPGLVLFLKPQFFHSCGQNVQSFFTLATADDFANAGYKQIHRGNGFTVII